MLNIFGFYDFRDIAKKIEKVQCPQNQFVESEKLNMNIVGKKWNSKNRSFNVGKFLNYDKTSIFLLLENLKKGIIIRSS